MDLFSCLCVFLGSVCFQFFFFFGFFLMGVSSTDFHGGGEAVHTFKYNFSFEIYEQLIFVLFCFV